MNKHSFSDDIQRATQNSPVEDDPSLIRQQAAAYREMAPFLDRLQKLVNRRNWPLGQNILKCAVEELERLTPKTTH